MLMAACGGPVASPGVTTSGVAEPAPATTAAALTTLAPDTLTTAVQPPAVVVGAGDIAVDGGAQEETARIIEQYPDAIVITTGDNAYPDGTAGQFGEYYLPTWGRFQERTRPAIGNHDARSDGAAPYFDFFGPNAGPPGRGWYSYDVGTWHVIVLNSECGTSGLASCEDQLDWLRRELTESATECMFAYWHKPLFNAGRHPGFTSFLDEWRVLDDAGVDFVVNGHDHNYQRFAPQHWWGGADEDGVREFVVGSGGAAPYEQTASPPALEFFYEGHGVMRFDLYPDRYTWTFITPDGGYIDAGTDDCE